MPISNRRQVLVAGAALLALPRLAQAQMRNVVDTLAGDPRFNRFLEIIGRGGATDQFRGAGPMTLFAPTDAAFNGASAAMLQDLLAQGTGGSGGGTLSGASPDIVRLRSLIGYHVIPGIALTPEQMTGDRQMKTVAGGVLRIASQGGTIAVTNPAPERQSSTFGVGGLNVLPPAAVDGAPIIATNGIIYPVTQILLP
ncbi:fasciclin domain-containing protein [Paracraurococcus ruber]|nr:fasciclin domain-containing protein [Paracraurococcus ruber]